MSDFFHEGAPDAWRIEAIGIMLQTRHQYQILTKRPENIAPFLKVNAYTPAGFPENIWIGATVERADVVHRIDTLRQVNAAVKFLSLEPLLGPLGAVDLTGIDWVIAGGESGPGARPMATHWVREVRDQCQAQNVPFFFKQWGSVHNNPARMDAPGGMGVAAWIAQVDPVGKGGSKLDGVEWKEYPRAVGRRGSDTQGFPMKMTR